MDTKETPKRPTEPTDQEKSLMHTGSTSKDFEIVRALGDLPPDAVITEDGLAKMFDRHGVSVRRAVERHELPPSVRLFGKPCWTIRAIRDHMAKRLEQAQREADRLNQKGNQLSA